MFAYVVYAEDGKGIFFITPLLSLVSAGGGWCVLKLWEQKMKRSVSELLKAKMEHLKQPHEIKAYQEERDYLKTQLEEARRGYEHQIDLLQSSVAKSKEAVYQLNLEMDKKLEEMRIAYLEFEDLRQEYHRLENDYQKAREESGRQLKHKESLINEYQRTISEQRMIIEKKQRYITQLEGKVRDLMYEIRSLLQLEEPSRETKLPLLDPSKQEMIDYYLPTSNQENTVYDLSLQLQRYIEKTENLTGANHLGYIGGKSPRFPDMSLDNYAIDRRRLFDSFRDEMTGIVFIYSQVEKKFLFVNHYLKTLLGWSPEKFMKDFPHLVLKGFPEWQNALVETLSMKETQTGLTIQSKSGEQSHFNCQMGLVSKGPFVDHVIGILAPSS